VRNRINKKSIGGAVLILATFFNPLGFDALFALVMKWTGSYWITDAIFYSLSVSLFGVYFCCFKEKKRSK
jgi:hypothetical protein